MKLPSFSLPVILEIIFFIGVIVGIPLAIIQLQQQQELRSRATNNTAFWATSQSAVSSCPTDKSGAIIKVTFKNTETNRTSTVMNVRATDKQTGKYITMNNIAGGQTKSGQISTGRANLAAGTVEFKLTWTDGHSGTDTKTANYSSVSNCQPSSTPTPKPSNSPTPKPSSSPTPKTSNTPTPKPSNTPTPKPSSTPSPTKTPTPTLNPSVTPTACPTLGPVQNVRIECPDCP